MMACEPSPLPKEKAMPRITHRFPKPLSKTLSRYEQLRDLRLAVQVRAEQVKLRRLEWDTQPLALPHITPLPGDGELQIRKPLTKGDLPAPRPPVKPPAFEPGMPSSLMSIMLDLYMTELREAQDRDPYNKLASISAQAKFEAKREREDARREAAKEKARKQAQSAERAAERAKARAEH